MRVVLVSNPRSTRNRRRGIADIEALAARRPDLLHLRLKEGATLAGLMGDLAGADLIVANSGDGTFQGLLTEILERPDLFPNPPLLSHMARGGANMTALDCGLRRGSAEGLARLLDLARREALAPFVVERAVLKVDYAAARRPERGLFLGIGGIVDGMMRFRRGAGARGLEGSFGHALTLVGLLARAAVKGPAAAGIGPHRVEVALGNNGPLQRRRLLLGLGTTLERLMLGFRPFWGEGRGSLRWTEIDHEAAGLLRCAPRVLYGSECRRLPPGYRSFLSERLVLGLDGPLALDGELFQPDPGRAVLITADERLRFVRL